MANGVARRIFEITELREHTWNPLAANPGQALYLLLARDYAPLGERLNSLAGRLSAVPAALAAARESLGRMPKVHLETAIAQFGGTIGLVTEEVNAALRRATDGTGATTNSMSGRSGSMCSTVHEGRRCEIWCDAPQVAQCGRPASAGQPACFCK